MMLAKASGIGLGGGTCPSNVSPACTEAFPASCSCQYTATPSDQATHELYRQPFYARDRRHTLSLVRTLSNVHHTIVVGGSLQSSLKDSIVCWCSEAIFGPIGWRRATLRQAIKVEWQELDTSCSDRGHIRNVGCDLLWRDAGVWKPSSC